jgi:hypothetical protein
MMWVCSPRMPGAVPWNKPPFFSQGAWSEPSKSTPDRTLRWHMVVVQYNHTSFLFFFWGAKPFCLITYVLGSTSKYTKISVEDFISTSYQLQIVFNI